MPRTKADLAGAQAGVIDESMKTLLPIGCAVLLANSGHANPVVGAANVEKTWERCLVCVSPSSATVSCAVGYIGKEFLDHRFNINFPVIIPKAMNGDVAMVLRTVKPRLEIDGQVLNAKEISFAPHKAFPDNTIVAVCAFSVPRAPGKSFSIVASYEQPVIDGRVYYLPTFEEGKSPESPHEYSISFFPSGSGTLTLKSTHQNRATSLATRITIHPAHDEIISIATTNG